MPKFVFTADNDDVILSKSSGEIQTPFYKDSIGYDFQYKDKNITLTLEGDMEDRSIILDPSDIDYLIDFLKAAKHQLNVGK